MRPFRTALCGLTLALGLAACGDLPTHSGADTRVDPPGAEEARFSGGCVSDGVCVLPPIEVVGEPCDPWTSLNWCRGPCEETGAGGRDGATAEGCEPGGGGEPGGFPGGPGGGSTPPPPGVCPDWDPFCASLPSPPAADVGSCPGCGERAPTAAEAADMEAAIERATCQDGRTLLAQMLAAGKIQVYTQSNGLYGAWNSQTQTIYVSRLAHWSTAGTVDADELADTLVHEIVHVLLDHRNGIADDAAHGSAFQAEMARCGFPQA